MTDSESEGEKSLRDGDFSSSLSHSSAILLHRTNFDTLVGLLQPDAFDRRASFHLHFHQLQRSAIPTLTYLAISNRRPLFSASPTLLKRNPTASQHPLPISRHLRVCPIIRAITLIRFDILLARRPRYDFTSSFYSEDTLSSPPPAQPTCPPILFDWKILHWGACAAADTMNREARLSFPSTTSTPPPPR